MVSKVDLTKPAEQTIVVGRLVKHKSDQARTSERVTTAVIDLIEAKDFRKFAEYDLADSELQIQHPAETSVISRQHFALYYCNNEYM